MFARVSAFIAPSRLGKKARTIGERKTQVLSRTNASNRNCYRNRSLGYGFFFFILRKFEAYRRLVSEHSVILYAKNMFEDKKKDLPPLPPETSTMSISMTCVEVRFISNVRRVSYVEQGNSLLSNNTTITLRDSVQIENL